MKIGILGAGGRMGQELIAAIGLMPTMMLEAAVVRSRSAIEGQKVSSPGERLYTSNVMNAFQACDVMIDFTLPSVTADFLKMALECPKPMMIGTTGLGEAEHALMARLGAVVPVVYAPNTSLGINLLYDLVEKAARILGPDFDVEIGEMHHRYKKDLPSGAALNLGRQVALGMGKNFDRLKEVRQENASRTSGSIGFSSKRGGGVFGDHDVFFASDEELLTFSHRALNRSVFAKGALRAATWVMDQKPGIYGMKDVLGL
jgi:4-hydroxy-tetrahydrodipicolinate reductase